MFAKDMHVSLLLDFYGDVLSERRREVTELYYNDDLSLAEIAEETGISRQGVRDAIKKSEAELFELEEKLGLAERFEELRQQIAEISSSLSEIASKSDYKENLESVVEKLKSLNI